MRKHIKHNTDIVILTNGTTYLVSVGNPPYYHWVFNGWTGVVTDDFFPFRFHVADKPFVGCRDWSDGI